MVPMRNIAVNSSYDMCMEDVCMRVCLRNCLLMLLIVHFFQFFFLFSYRNDLQ